MDSTLAALLGAVIGGLLSVLASWLAQRVQSRSQLLVQEIQRRQLLYSGYVKSAACCYADALQANEPDPGPLSELYGDIGQMRLQSSEAVVEEASKIAHRILAAYRDRNRTRGEIRDFLDGGESDLFVAFGNACRAELAQLEPIQAVQMRPSAPRRKPVRDASSPP